MWKWFCTSFCPVYGSHSTWVINSLPAFVLAFEYQSGEINDRKIFFNGQFAKMNVRRILLMIREDIVGIWLVKPETSICSIFSVYDFKVLLFRLRCSAETSDVRFVGIMAESRISVVGGLLLFSKNLHAICIHPFWYYDVSWYPQNITTHRKNDQIPWSISLDM